MVQATSAYVASNTVWNVGSATLTTVMSRIDMIAPRTTTPATLRTAASSFVSAGAAGVALTSPRYRTITRDLIHSWTWRPIDPTDQLIKPRSAAAVVQF